jgi:hypothetical protein
LIVDLIVDHDLVFRFLQLDELTKFVAAFPSGTSRP